MPGEGDREAMDDGRDFGGRVVDDEKVSSKGRISLNAGKEGDGGC